MVGIPRRKSKKYSLILHAEAPGVHGIIETVDDKPYNIVALLLDNTENSLALEIKRWLDESREKMILDIQQISEDIINFSIRTVDEELREKQEDLNKKNFFKIGYVTKDEIVEQEIVTTFIRTGIQETAEKYMDENKQSLYYEKPDFLDNPVSMEEAIRALKEVAKKYANEEEPKSKGEL